MNKENLWEEIKVVLENKKFLSSYRLKSLNELIINVVPDTPQSVIDEIRDRLSKFITLQVVICYAPRGKLQ